MAVQSDVPMSYRVTRRPGAPPRRAGRAWPVGETVVDGLAPDQVAQIASDPRYVLAAEDAPPAPAPKPARKPRQPKV